MRQCEIGSIRAVHRRLIDEGYQVSEYVLRQWVKHGILPAIYSGSKALISYKNVLGLLESGLRQSTFISMST